ncbi:MAG: polysaccharide deacetylase family protein [bacterium]|nr:polysaccharide deacetylase family protein [bacterium]
MSRVLNHIPEFIVPTLLYHTVLESGCDITAVSKKQFDVHMQIVHEMGFQTYSIAKLWNMFSEGQDVPNNAISIQFDDGYEDTISVALPILARHSFSAIIFIITEYIGKINCWDHRVDRFIRHMTKDEISNLIDRGFEIGAHTRTHHNLRKFSEAELDKELAECRNKLERTFNIQVPVFSYPYGEYNLMVKALVRKHFDIAFSVSKGVQNWHHDTHTITRFQLNRHTKIKDLITYLKEYESVNTQSASY